MTSLHIFSAQLGRHICSWNNLHEANFNWLTETHSHSLQKKKEIDQPCFCIRHREKMQAWENNNWSSNTKVFPIFVVLHISKLNLFLFHFLNKSFSFLLQQYCNYSIHWYASCPIILLFQSEWILEIKSPSKTTNKKAGISPQLQPVVSVKW